MENQIIIEKDELKKAIDDSVKAVVKELKLDEVAASPLSVRGTDATEGIFSDPGYALHSLLCAIKSGNRDEIKEIYERTIAAGEKAASPMTEGTPGDGGYLVPDVTQATILELLPAFGQGRQFMSQIPMGKTDTLNIPREANLPVVNWVNENAPISDAKPTIGQITLTAKKAAGIVVLSNELFRDANVAIGNYILKKFAQKFGTAEDVQFFNGTGTPFNGVFKSTNTFGNTVTLTGQIDTLTYQSLVDCVYGIDSSLLAGGSWFMHRTVLAKVRNIMDSQNRPIFVPASEGTPATLLGYPVRLIENAPASTSPAGSVVILLGNLQNSYIGTKSEISVKILEEATIGGTSLAENDLTAIRVIERVGFNAGLTDAYSVIKLASV